MTRTLRVLATRTLRVSRQIVAPNGKHRPRPRRPLLLPDTPIAPPADAARRAAVLDEDTLETLLDGGDVVANESAPCPACERTTFHAMHRDESRRCWTCGVTTLAGAA